MTRPTRLARITLAAALTACATGAGTLQEQGAGPAPAPPPRQPAPQQPPQDKAAATAVDAAADYAQRMKSDQPASAVRTYWDIDAMLADIFGEHLKRNSGEERAEMKRLLLTFVENVYSHPDIAAAMKQAAYEDFREEVGPAAGTTAVTFTVRFGDKVVPNALHMKKTDGTWKIFDACTNGRMMVGAIRSQYEAQAQRVTPLEYVKAMVVQVPAEKGDQTGPRRQ